MHKKPGVRGAMAVPGARSLRWLPLALLVGTCTLGAEERTAGEATTTRITDTVSVNSEETDMYGLTVERLDGSSESLADHRGKLLLIVNTASECGMTPQYKDLQELHKRYGSRGLRVMGFPCNEFGGQEPGDARQIQDFCQARFGVEFPMYAKVQVLGEGAAPLFQWLKENAPGDKQHEIKWNFTKFLVDGQGRVVDRFEPRTEPLDKDVIARIEELLAQE